MVRNVERGRRDPVVQLLVNSDQPALAARVLGGEGVSHQLSYELWRGNSVNAPPMPLAAVAGT